MPLNPTQPILTWAFYTFMILIFFKILEKTKCVHLYFKQTKCALETGLNESLVFYEVIIRHYDIGFEPFSKTDFNLCGLHAH